MTTKIEDHVIAVARELRIKHKMSQADLADELGVSYGFIGKVESSVYPTKYNLNHINKLSEIFSVSPKVFLPKTSL